MSGRLLRLLRYRGILYNTEKCGDRNMTPWEFWTAWPLFRHMIEIIPNYS